MIEPILTWYWIEVYVSKLLQLFGRKLSKEEIPPGPYCYLYDAKRNKNTPIKNGYWTIPCKYFRRTKKRGGVACTYVGFIGFDVGLYDQCKICGENDDLD